MGVFPRGQRPRRGGIEGSWLAALLALAPCDFLWPGLARCEARDVCLGLNEQQYYCDSGHCCGDNGCCTYYYELWWFWLLWTLVVLLSCCCAYRHRRSKLRSHQRARQRRIDMLAYRGACNYPGPPLDIRLMAVCKLPPYEEAILTQADTSPPPPYSELGPQRGGGLDVGPPPTASSDSSLGGGMVILHHADGSPEPHTDPSDYRPSASPPPALPPPSPPPSPAATATWSAATEDEGGCEPPVTRDPEEEEHGEQGAGQAAGGEVCGVEPSRDKEVAVTLTSTPTPASTPNPSVTPNVTPSVIQSVTQSVAPRPGSGKKRARFCPRLDVTVEIADGEESRTATHQEELPGNHGNDDDRDDGGGGEFGCGDDDDDDDGEETDHFRHRRLTGDSGIDVRPPDLVCDDDDGDNEVMEKDEEVALTHGRLATELGAKAHNGGQASAPQSSQLARTP